MFQAAALALLVFAADPIPAAKARQHLDREGTFALTVRSSRDVPDSKVYFLNSERDYKDAKNLVLVIEYEDAAPFQEAGIANPASHYRGKAIRVTGTPVEERGQTRIRVTSPEQIEVVKK